MVGFPGESHGPATCGSACNCPEPEAWTTEESGQWAMHVVFHKYYKLLILVKSFIAILETCLIIYANYLIIYVFGNGYILSLLVDVFTLP